MDARATGNWRADQPKRTRGQPWVLAAIVLGAAALAVRWVFLVPIYQSPDEPLHLDYALCLHAHGGLFRAADSPAPRRNNSGENVFTHDYLHPYTNYLMERSGAGPIVFNVPAKVAPDYGTDTFFERLDADAVPWNEAEVREAPILFRMYPFGYYALLAVWVNGLQQLNARLSFVFFGARLLSVLMLAGTLLLSYGTLRALRQPRTTSLLVTAVVGFFPLSSFIASYIQPDNLSWLLVSACFYLSLQVRRQPERWVNQALLGLAFGALLVTKVHYFLVVALPIAGLLAGELWWSPVNSRNRRLAAAALLAVPSLATGVLYAWTQAGIQHAMQPPARQQHALLHLLVWTKKAFRDYYVGLTHKSFWGTFGWLDTPLVFYNDALTQVMRHSLVVVGLVFLVLTLVRGQQVAGVLLRLARRGHWRLAWRVTFSNPLLNSYFLFTALMFVLYVRLENAFGGQGRNWLPFLLPFVLTGLVYVPKVFRTRRRRALCTATVLAALLAFDGFGSYYALASIARRYYPSYYGKPVQLVTLPADRPSVREKQPLTLALPEPRFVYGLQIRYVFTHDAGQQSQLHIAWSGPDGNKTMLHIIPDRRLKTVTLPVEGVIDGICLETDTGPSRFELYELSLMCPTNAGR
jgi:4-amino-4-deoxy-L-arabinose transferase-like glycosyltransferase